MSPPLSFFLFFLFFSFSNMYLFSCLFLVVNHSAKVYPFCMFIDKSMQRHQMSNVEHVLVSVHDSI